MDNIFVNCSLFWISLAYLSDKFNKDSEQDDTNASNLNPISLMLVEDNADSGRQNFSAADSKRHKMLFELLNHAIDKELTKARNNRHDNEIRSELQMLPHIDEERPQVHSYQPNY